MDTLSYILATAAIIGCAVTYGTDTFAAVVWRTSLRHLDNSTLTHLVGYVHYYGDRRLPIPGVFGFVTAILAPVAAFIADRPTAGFAGVAAVVALSTWMLIYVRIAKPVNAEFTTAALEGKALPNAEALQAKWDSVINFRVGLQMFALAAICASLALP